MGEVGDWAREIWFTSHLDQRSKFKKKLAISIESIEI